VHYYHGLLILGGAKKMKCPQCNSEMECKAGTHHYEESGLDNVIVKGIDICACVCGEKIVCISKIDELHKLIGVHLIKKKSLLNGKEIRFLRKNMGLTATKLAAYMGVDNATISRWENTKHPITKPHDLLLRVVYSNIKGISQNETKNLIEDEFKKVLPKQKKQQKFTIWADRLDACVPA
jgi:putative zinc finger/helix-turn-helix YgiT family protein